MKKLTLTQFLHLGLILTLGMTAQVFAKEISIHEGYVRATIPCTQVSSAYMEITNNSDKAAVLVAVSGEVSNRIEIHQHTMENGLMKMRQQESLTIPAKGVVKLQPGGYHLMIFNLVQPLKVDEKISLTLHFNDESTTDLRLPVKSIMRKKQTENHHHHH